MLYKKILKRMFDVLFAISILLIFLPVIVFISAIIYFESQGSIFYINNRAGKDGKSFKMIKFRTMIQGFKDKGIDEHEAITKFGLFLRKTSLDEIPEFLNILIGDMSVVGPRPLLTKYVPRYNEKHFMRLSVKPGITGLAQVSGRNSLSWEDKFDIDVEYVDNISLLGDLKIIFLTIKVILYRDNIDSSGKHMEEFKGYK